MSSITVIRGSEIPSASSAVSTEKWTRRVIDVDERITINQARNGPDAASNWHHHGDNTGCVYVLQGQLRIEWGAGGHKVENLSAGDIYVISPQSIHRETNPGSEDQVLIAFVVGSGPKFVDAEGPEPGVPSSGDGAAVNVARRGAIPAGPASGAMTRRVVDVNEAISVAEARNAPGTLSGWHHHGGRTTCVYVVKGRTRLEWGPGGRESVDLAAGDFYLIGPNTIHREGNPGADDQLIAGFYLGSGSKVVNVDGPERT